MTHEDSFYMSLRNILDLFLTEHSSVLLFFHIPVNKILQSFPLHLVLNSRGIKQLGEFCKFLQKYRGLRSLYLEN